MSYVIAIDGPSASGKGTLSKLIAQSLDFAHLDTGLVYRYLAKAVLDRGLDETCVEDVIALAREIEAGFELGDIDPSVLRSDAVSQMTSKTSAIPEVREILKDIQIGFAAYPPKPHGGAVLDGRDIGTVIAPEADVKLFVTASTEVRAERRYKELHNKDKSVMYGAVLQEMRERDERDSNRSVAPLRPADDAFVLDTSDLNIDQALEKALEIIRSKIGE